MTLAGNSHKTDDGFMKTTALNLTQSTCHMCMTCDKRVKLLHIQFA